MEEYIANGVRLGLLIDRKSCQVRAYRQSMKPQVLDHPETVSCDPEMPGFVLKMTKIW